MTLLAEAAIKPEDILQANPVDMLTGAEWNLAIGYIRAEIECVHPDRGGCFVHRQLASQRNDLHSVACAQGLDHMRHGLEHERRNVLAHPVRTDNGRPVGGDLALAFAQQIDTTVVRWTVHTPKSMDARSDLSDREGAVCGQPVREGLIPY